jgi:hypothetical protein
LTQACSIFTPAPSERIEFFTLQDFDSVTGSEDIRKNLQKSASNAGGYYKVSAMPLTAPYLQARRHELAIARGLSPAQVAELELADRQNFLLNRFCVEVDAEITRHQQVLSLHEWSIVALDGEGVPHTMHWREARQNLVQSQTMGAHGPEDRWLLSSVACTQQDFEVTPEFSVNITPPFTPWPFPDTMRLRWAFYKNSQQAREKSPNFRRYRGY